jgi:hypothetical protein
MKAQTAQNVEPHDMEGEKAIRKSGTGSLRQRNFIHSQSFCQDFLNKFQVFWLDKKCLDV